MGSYQAYVLGFATGNQIEVQIGATEDNVDGGHTASPLKRQAVTGTLVDWLGRAPSN